MKYKLVKPARGRYWVVRLAAPCADGWQQRSTKQTRRREAEREAAKLVAGIGTVDPQRITWRAFRRLYEAEKLRRLKRPGCFKSAANKLESVLRITYLDELNAPAMQRYRQKLEQAGLSPPSVASYCKHIRAALGWAEEGGYIQHAPRVRAGSTARMKGRPLTLEEFERLLVFTPKVVGRPRAGQWKHLLWGLWTLGLRLQEALDLHWDGEEVIRLVRLDGANPLLCFPGSQQKNGKDQLIPITPEAAEYLRKTPQRLRTGRVFPLEGAKRPITNADRASRIISAIGQRAGIITRTEGKTCHATAHDLRRSFATRLAKRVPPDLLQELMRHADIKTTKTHYAETDAEHLSSRLNNALQ